MKKKRMYGVRVVNNMPFDASGYEVSASQTNRGDVSGSGLGVHAASPQVQETAVFESTHQITLHDRG